MLFHQSAVVAFAALLAVASVDAASLRGRQLADGATYSSTDQSWQKLMLAKVNAVRAEKGLKALCLNSKLNKAAQGHSEDMAAKNYYEHEGLDGSEPADRAQKAGFGTPYVSENIMAGVADIDSAMDSWINSSGHLTNILGESDKFLGVGYGYDANSEWKHYWTQNFGESDQDSCDVDDSSSSVAGEADDSSAAVETTAPAGTEPATLAPTTDSSETTDASAADEEPETTEAPDATEASTDDEPTETDASEVTDASANDEYPETTDASEVTDASANDEYPESTEEPDATEASANEEPVVIDDTPAAGSEAEASIPAGPGCKRRF